MQHPNRIRTRAVALKGLLRPSRPANSGRHRDKGPAHLPGRPAADKDRRQCRRVCSGDRAVSLQRLPYVGANYRVAIV